MGREEESGIKHIGQLVRKLCLVYFFIFLPKEELQELGGLDGEFVTLYLSFFFVS